MQVGPPEGFTPPDLDEEPQLTSPIGPDIDADMFNDVAKKLFASCVGAAGGALRATGYRFVHGGRPNYR